jgi:exodeoxyribonuclease VII large subunit
MLPAMNVASNTNQEPVLTVSQLNQQVHYLLEQSFPYVYVKGEVSNFMCPASGHWYFSLKDQNAQVRCAMFKSKNRSCRFDMKNGVQVMATAKVSLYEARGDFQLIVEAMEEFGQGALQVAFDKLKAKLDKEGLFAEGNKKTLPTLPKQIGVVTSATGAALQDILRVLKRRMPSIPVVVYPTLVQGEQAAEQIVHAIEVANNQAVCDVLIVARGGGSLEDLWPFNEEIVARAIYASEIPVVSGVGHQIDYTIADFVADHRAATPSAAAEVVSPDQFEILQQLENMQRRLTHMLNNKLEQLMQQLDWLSNRLQQTHPEKQLQQQAELLQQFKQRLLVNQSNRIQQLTQQVQVANEKLLQQDPRKKIATAQLQLQHQAEKLTAAINKTLLIKQQQLQQIAATLNAASPLATLARGYAVIKDSETNKVIRKKAEVKTGSKITAMLDKFEINCLVESIS